MVIKLGFLRQSVVAMRSWLAYSDGEKTSFIEASKCHSVSSIDFSPATGLLR